MELSERDRLRVLADYRVMDTASEKAFDDLTRLAAAICDVPISLVSLVDDRRQWFKARYGLTTAETPRESAFCEHALGRDEPLVIEDAQADPTFRDNPLVTGEPHIRFYAGAPLRVREGARLGTLCVIDRQPRRLSEHQLHCLRILRDAVVSQLELRKATMDLQDMEALLPVCAWCHKIKREEGGEERWQPLHEYVADVTPVSHGICPDCRARELQQADG